MSVSSSGLTRHALYLTSFLYAFIGMCDAWSSLKLVMCDGRPTLVLYEFLQFICVYYFTDRHACQNSDADMFSDNAYDLYDYD